MKKEQNIIDDLFRSKLENFEQEPNPEVWQKVRQSLDSSRKRRIPVWIRLSGAAAILLIAILIGWQELSRQNTTNLPQEISQQIQSETQENDINESEEPVQNEPGVNNLHAQDQQVAIAESTKQEVPYNNISTVQSQPVEREVENLTTLNPVTLRRIDNNKYSENSLTISFLLAQWEAAYSLTEADRAIIQENINRMEGNEVASTVENPWSIGVGVTPNYSLYQTSQGEMYASNMSYPGSTNDVNIDGGITVEYKLNDKWSISSGIYFDKKDQSSKNYTTYNTFNANTIVGNSGAGITNDAVFSGSHLAMNSIAGVIEIDNLPQSVEYVVPAETLLSTSSVSLSRSSFDQQFEYIEIPFILNYKLLNTTFDISLMGGINAGLLIGNKAYLENSLGKYEIGKTLGMKKVNYSTSVGVGFGYRINNQFSISLEPRVKYYLGSLNKNPSLTYRPYTFGLYSGINYNF